MIPTVHWVDALTTPMDEELRSTGSGLLENVPQSQMNHKRIFVWADESLWLAAALILMDYFHNFQIVGSVFPRCV
jgi:hypothetical protein